MTYSLDFREKVLSIQKKEKLSFRQTSHRFGIGTTTLLRWTKNIEAKKTRLKPWKKINLHALTKDVEDYPDAYQKERAERLGISPSGVRHGLKHLKVTYKKNPKSSQSRSRKKIYILPKDQ